MTTKKMLIWKMMKTKLTVAKPSIDHEQLAIAQPEAAWVVLESVCAVTSYDVDEIVTAVSYFDAVVTFQSWSASDDVAIVLATGVGPYVRLFVGPTSSRARNGHVYQLEIGIAQAGCCECGVSYFYWSHELLPGDERSFFWRRSDREIVFFVAVWTHCHCAHDFASSSRHYAVTVSLPFRNSPLDVLLLCLV